MDSQNLGAGKVGLESFPIFVKKIQPVVSAHKKPSVGQFLDGPDPVVTDGVGIVLCMPIGPETFGHRIETVEPSLVGSNPDDSLGVLTKGIDAVIIDTVGIVGVGKVIAHLTRMGIVHAHAVAPCAHITDAIVADSDQPHGMDGRIMLKTGETIPVVPVQFVPGAKPHETVFVLGDGVDNRVGEPVFHGKMVENDLVGLSVQGGNRLQQEQCERNENPCQVTDHESIDSLLM